MEAAAEIDRLTKLNEKALESLHEMLRIYDGVPMFGVDVDNKADEARNLLKEYYYDNKNDTSSTLKF